MSAFATKFEPGNVLPSHVPTHANYNPANFGSTAVGGRKSRRNKMKTRKSTKANKTRNMRKRNRTSRRR